MGKKRAAKDRAYLTASEWREEHGGCAGALGLASAGVPPAHRARCGAVGQGRGSEQLELMWKMAVAAARRAAAYTLARRGRRGPSSSPPARPPLCSLGLFS